MATKIKDHLSSRKLPIQDYRDELIKAVEKSQCVVITGETGCGKTTQLPQYLKEAGLARHGIIGVTQPRRVAAISVAHRVAEEVGSRVGMSVGYKVRFDDMTDSSRTIIKYMTDGCLLREFLDDQELSLYSVVVLDEAHERSLATDILFGLVKKLLQMPFSEMKKRKDALKVVVMSATLDVTKFSQFFDSCPVFTIPGRVFPVDVRYCCSDDSFDTKRLTYLSQMTRTVMSIHLEQPEGDILVFLTGQSEIENICNRLFKAAEAVDYNHDVECKDVRGVLILPLYGALPSEQQQRVFKRVEPGIRRVIVATNIAATSLTIDGVVYVVDSGFVKQLAYNPRTGLDSLDIVPVAKSEAIQRCGRAGRTKPGHCYRLFSRKFYDSLEETTVPEIQRSSLTSVVLDLKCMGIPNVVEFSYLDPPEEKMLLEALRQLYYFQAIDENGVVTELGHRLVEFPLQPSLARALIRSKQLACEDAILPIVSMLSVESIFVRPSNKKEAERAMKVHKELAEAAGGTSDFATLLAIYKMATDSGNLREWCKEHCVHMRGIKTARSICDQLDSILTRQKVNIDKDLTIPLGQRARQALCYGLFCNTARVSGNRRSFRTMDGHCTSAYIHPGSSLFGSEESLDWIVYFELVETTKTYMRTICPIRYQWVQDLLPQLHNIDVYRLSDCEKKRERKDSDGGDAQAPPTKRRLSEAAGDASQDGDKKREELKQRAASAKERYLARKTAQTY
ncbi:probable ATP-dependent RNA helicase DHX40 [Halichondria panicea]|uniref:probable ATP-dependent RNA helicase DHX40 n=1 Tax=Halichondria panicea TaxID=6063 RepID=UPI00312BB639